MFTCRFETASSGSVSYPAVALCNTNGICEWKQLNSLFSQLFFFGGGICLYQLVLQTHPQLNLIIFIYFSASCHLKTSLFT